MFFKGRLNIDLKRQLAVSTIGVEQEICSECSSGSFVIFLDTIFCCINFHLQTFFFFPFPSFQGRKNFLFHPYLLPGVKDGPDGPCLN